MKLQKIYQKDFLTWDDYYFQYQKNLAREYYIPLLKNWGVDINGKRIQHIDSMTAIDIKKENA